MADMTSTASALGPRFVQALATKDSEALRAVLHPDVDFRGLTPNRFWEAHDRDAVLDIVFGVWFGAHDDLEELVLLESDAFADREQVRFRFRGRNRDGPMIVEQQAYLAERDNLIGSDAHRLLRPAIPGVTRAALRCHARCDAAF
jgi:hypothetical protein